MFFFQLQHRIKKHHGTIITLESKVQYYDLQHYRKKKNIKVVPMTLKQNWKHYSRFVLKIHYHHV